MEHRAEGSFGGT